MENVTAEFAPIAARMRWHRRLLLAGVVSIAAYFFVHDSLPHGLQSAANVFGILAWFVAFGALGLSFLVRPTCPRCHSALDQLGTYCPECGVNGISKGSWLISANCKSCKRSLSFGGRSGQRSFRIRVCTHCGVLLDNAGV